MRFGNGRNTPVATCDICRRHLTDVHLAAVVFPVAKEGYERGGVIFVHKDIGDLNCHKVAEKKIQDAGDRPGWIELSLFLSQLTNNTGFPAEKMVEYESNYLKHS